MDNGPKLTPEQLALQAKIWNMPPPRPFEPKRNNDPLWQALWDLAAQVREPHTISRGEMIDAAYAKIDALRTQPSTDPVREELLEALEAVKRLIDEALPKFDWGKSALDANTIVLLNEVPVQVDRAIARAKEQSS